MTVRARALRAAGHRVISLAIGEPDFATPPHAVEAAHQAARAGDTHYPPQDGTPALKEAIRRKFARDNGLDYALDEIMVANGGKQIIANAFLATLDAGDEVVIPAPYWISYADQAKFAGGVPRFVACPQNNGFRLRAEDLEAAITPRTKWVVLNSPNNPSGAALGEGELCAIAEVIRRHPDLWVLSDDIYEHLIYDGFRFVTLAQVAPDLRERVLTVNGCSKAYAMTGWRVGFCGGPRALIRAMVNVQGQLTSGVCTVAQAAAAAALDGPQELVRQHAETYRRRRDLVVAMLNEAPGIACHRPEGAFYVYPSVAGLIGRTTPAGRRLETDLDVAMALLEEAHVAVVHG
ncbi:MAG: pyridoxal phosphate-dependent aminotransferase, partial [Elioraea sp.]|nr:pyridoxal phosphate-dependent aminotransferase [Elioraea sp.]